MVRVHPDPPVFPLKTVLSEGYWFPFNKSVLYTLIHTWFCVYKNKKFLEDHDVLDKFGSSYEQPKKKGSKGIFP